MNQAEKQFLATHAAHDVEAVLAAWREIAAAAGLTRTELAEEGGFPVVAYETQALLTGQGRMRRARGGAGGASASGGSGGSSPSHAVYLCAGVHGDEPAPVWGLVEWAHRNLALLKAKPFLIFPCFNPWGLANNTRHDSRGEDLNRLFHSTDRPLFRAWREFLAKRHFLLSLNLHEDYDARGIYVYELGRRGHDLGEPLLGACEHLIPREPGSDVDGNPIQRGIVQRKKNIRQIVEERLEGAFPESIYLYLHHSRFALTFETPSEYSLYVRVRTHQQFIASAMKLADRLANGAKG